MPYYIYLQPHSQSLNTFWKRFQNRVGTGYLPDFQSLQYPPHITLACSFKSTPEEISALVKDIENIFSVPFESKGEIELKFSLRIHSYDIWWDELSRRVTRICVKYPHIPFVLHGYHLTLAHGPHTSGTGVFKAMKRVSQIIPTISFNDFSVVVWEHTPVENAMFSWMSKKWKMISKVHLNTLEY